MLNPGAVPSIRKRHTLIEKKSMLTKVKGTNEDETVNDIEELQSEGTKLVRDNEYVEPQINIQVAHLSEASKIEPANVNPLQDKLFSQNVLRNISRSKYKY